MARVTTGGRFDISPRPNQKVAFKAGKSYTVKRDWARQAIATGLAEEVDVPPRATAPAKPTPPRGRPARTIK